jgi:thiol-disulfide isomerase/thioredoxin
MFKHLSWIGLLAVSLVLASRSASPQVQPEPLRAELLAPKNIEPVSAAEFRRVLAHHRGSVVLVNLWATWCAPCLKELPELAKLQEAHGKQGLKIVTVSMDDPAKIESARKLLGARAPGLRGYLQTESEQDKFVSVIEPAWNEIMPTTFVLDREGRLKATLAGGKKSEEFEAVIAPLLKDLPQK